MSGYTEYTLNNTNPEKRQFDLIGKPFRKQDLARKLRSILERVSP
jgi:hypothetical protein